MTHYVDAKQDFGWVFEMISTCKQFSYHLFQTIQRIRHQNPKQQNLVKLDMCAMPHTSRRMFFPSCTFLSSHLLFCRFTPHFAISTRTTFHTLFIHRRQMWQKRNSMKGEEFNKDRAFCNGLLYLGVVLKLRWQKEVGMWFVKCQRY